MEMNEYQQAAHNTAVYPEEFGPIYPALKLAGEAGEVAEKIGKHIRSGQITLDSHGDGEAFVDAYLHPDQRDELVKELGDVLWYVAELATVLDVRLDDVARLNINKLSSRSIRGVIVGEGDNR